MSLNINDFQKVCIINFFFAYPKKKKKTEGGPEVGLILRERERERERERIIIFNKQD